MGDTSSCFLGGSDAVEGVFGNGRKAAVCGSPASRRGNGGSLQGVWDLAQDRLQNLRSLPGVWGARVDGPKPTALPLCESMLKEYCRKSKRLKSRCLLSTSPMSMPITF